MNFDEVIDRSGTNSLKWQRYGREVLPLWVADMDFAAPEPARAALRAAIDHGIFGYEMPSRKLAETVAARMHRLYGWEVSPEAVVASPGIVAGFKAAARAVCNPGGGVLIQPPVYHPFLDVPGHTGTVLQSARLVERTFDKAESGKLKAESGKRKAESGKRKAESGKRKAENGKRKAEVEDIAEGGRVKGSTVRYEIDWGVFEGAVHSNNARTEMLLLCHPHNPTGQIYSRPDLERMARICLEAGAVICSDEIHSELVLGGARHVPVASIDPEIARRSITLVSPSKTFNLVGLFCGFAIIPDAELRARFREVLNQLGLHVNSLGQIAAEVAMSGACDAWLEELRRYLTGNRDFLVEYVARELPQVRVTVPDATYLAWMDFGEVLRSGRMGNDPSRFLLKEGKVALNPGTEFGPGGEGFARLNFGCPRATLEEGLRRIKGANIAES